TYAKRLEELYPGYLANRLTHRLVDWPKEPHIMTGYAVPAPMQVTTIVKNLSGSFQDRLFFAGEQTSPGFFGYMGGALQSGLFASYKVAVAIRRSLPVRGATAPGRKPAPTTESMPASLLRHDAAADLFDRVAANVDDHLDGRFQTVGAPRTPLLRPL